jgi:hypothetical protein
MEWAGGCSSVTLRGAPCCGSQPTPPVPGTGGHDGLNRSIEAYIANLADGSRDIGGTAKAERRAKLARISRIKKWRFQNS